MTMIRTQVYLPRDIYLNAKLYATAQNTTISQLIRQGLKQTINHKTRHDLLDGFTVKLKKGQKKPPKDLAVNLDYYLYEQPHENNR